MGLKNRWVCLQEQAFSPILPSLILPSFILLHGFFYYKNWALKKNDWNLKTCVLIYLFFFFPFFFCTLKELSQKCVKCGCFLFYLLNLKAGQSHTQDTVTKGLVNDVGERSLFSLHPSTHKSYVQHRCLLSNGFSTFTEEIVFLIIPSSMGKQLYAQSPGPMCFCSVLSLEYLYFASPWKEGCSCSSINPFGVLPRASLGQFVLQRSYKEAICLEWLIEEYCSYRQNITFLIPSSFNFLRKINDPCILAYVSRWNGAITLGSFFTMSCIMWYENHLPLLHLYLRRKIKGS